MAFYLSPLVDINEVDLTTTIPAVATSIAATVLRKTFKGPELKATLITTVEDIVETFGEPTSDSYKDMLSAMGYLKYGDKLWCTRSMPASATFAGVYGTPGISGASDATLYQYDTNTAHTLSSPSQDSIVNDPDEFDSDNPFSTGNPGETSTIAFIAASRGAWGNYTKIAIIDKQSSDAVIEYGSGKTNANYATYVLSGGTLSQNLYNDVLDTDIKVESQREFVILVESADQSDLNMSTIPYDLKEVWYVSTDENKLDDEGKNIFAINIINRESKYIRIAMASSVKNADFYCRTNSYQALAGGKNSYTEWSDAVIGATAEDSQVQLAFNLYKNSEVIDVNILIDSDKNISTKQYLVDLCETRKDCIALLDCRQTDVVNQDGSEVTNLRNYRRNTLNENTSYAAIYGNWLEVFDTWNSNYRWIPASGHVAGIFANTDDLSDPWFAPAGLNRALLTNIRRLAWSPTQGERDILYKNGINPIVSFAGQGKVIWGQKTLLDKPSAFNRINVRRLFVVMEKAISTAAKYFLFEPNDEFTRLGMVNMIEPFLRDVRGRRGVYDFMIVCDERNNTSERIDRQELWVDIYVKPTKAAEFIVLNFVATKTGASFTELIGVLGEGL